MNSRRCAACKYLRRKCSSTCILSPYFPPNDPQRFSFVHKIYGASNVAKMLQQVPMHKREEAADSLYYEANCRINDPIYGCVGIITLLQQQINSVQNDLAIINAEIANQSLILNHDQQIIEGITSQSFDKINNFNGEGGN